MFAICCLLTTANRSTYIQNPCVSHDARAFTQYMFFSEMNVSLTVAVCTWDRGNPWLPFISVTQWIAWLWRLMALYIVVFKEKLIFPLCYWLMFLELKINIFSTSLFYKEWKTNLKNLPSGHMLENLREQSLLPGTIAVTPVSGP